MADPILAARVRSALDRIDSLRALGSHILIEAENGRVVLSGRTRTSVMRALAERQARSVPGVSTVENRIIPDPALVQAVATALAADPRTARLSPRVDARHGVVYLLGKAPDQQTVEAALQIASAVPGVERAESQMELPPPPAPARPAARRAPEAAAVAEE